MRKLKFINYRLHASYDLCVKFSKGDQGKCYSESMRNEKQRENASDATTTWARKKWLHHTWWHKNNHDLVINYTLKNYKIARLFFTLLPIELENKIFWWNCSTITCLSTILMQSNCKLSLRKMPHRHHHSFESLTLTKKFILICP